MNLYLAPMEGVTDRVFRQAYCRCFEPLDKYFAPFLTPNENGKLGPRDLAQLDPERNPGCLPIPQILTNQAEGFIRTAAQLKRMGYQEINLNLGCPSGTVVSKGRGAGFLAFPEQLDSFLYQVFSAMESMNVKLSIKTRIGVEQPEEFEALLDRRVPAYTMPQRGAYTLNTTLCELQGSRWGRAAQWLVRRYLHLRHRADADAEETDFAIAAESPLRQAIVGGVPRRLVCAFLALCNGTYGRALSALLGKEM